MFCLLVFSLAERSSYSEKAEAVTKTSSFMSKNDMHEEYLNRSRHDRSSAAGREILNLLSKSVDEINSESKVILERVYRGEESNRDENYLPHLVMIYVHPGLTLREMLNFTKNGTAPRRSTILVKSKCVLPSSSSSSKPAVDVQEGDAKEISSLCATAEPSITVDLTLAALVVFVCDVAM